MKTATAGISAATLSAFLTAYAMVPLPTFEGSPTGLKVTYQILSTPHIKQVTEWVANLDDLSDRKDSNGEAINEAQFNYFMQGIEKPKKYEFDDREEYMDAMEDWREEKRDLRDTVKKLKEDRSDLIGQRRQMIAKSPAKTLSAL